MSETEFPQFGHYWRNEHVYGEVEAFDIGAVEDWFKRCIEDYKRHLAFDKHSWFIKWFSQFQVKDE